MKTKIALMIDENVAGSAVNVDTVNGRVTLHGKVETVAQRARAEEIAQQVEGVTQVRNLLQVVPDASRKILNLEDAAVRKQVQAALESDAGLRDSQIRVQSVNKGVVLLAGKASKLSSHLRAIRLASAVDGVRRVASEVQSPDQLADREIRQDEMAAQIPAKSDDQDDRSVFSDMWISTAAKMRLLADSETPAMDINVDTDNGVVTLFGVVPTKQAKQAAENDVWKVAGVKRVDNALEVVPIGAQKAGEVKDDISLGSARSALATNTGFKDVSVEVSNGVARLSGSVASQSDWLMAAVTVRAITGIRSVNNDLKVQR
jgi:hyperosmotically inducible protein